MIQNIEKCLQYLLIFCAISSHSLCCWTIHNFLCGLSFLKRTLQRSPPTPLRAVERKLWVCYPWWYILLESPGEKGMVEFSPMMLVFTWEPWSKFWVMHIKNITANRSHILHIFEPVPFTFIWIWSNHLKYVWLWGVFKVKCVLTCRTRWHLQFTSLGRISLSHLDSTPYLDFLICNSDLHLPRACQYLRK